MSQVHKDALKYTHSKFTHKYKVPKRCLINTEISKRYEKIKTNEGVGPKNHTHTKVERRMDPRTMELPSTME